MDQLLMEMKPLILVISFRIIFMILTVQNVYMTVIEISGVMCLSLNIYNWPSHPHNGLTPNIRRTIFDVWTMFRRSTDMSQARKVTKVAVRKKTNAKR